ncbi:MAG: nucleoside triphosphate pyrophosphatase [Pseudomonadota bacterium]
MAAEQICLASGSRARAELLRGAGLNISVRPSGVDEDFLKAQMAAQGSPLGDTALRLSEAKALRVAEEMPGLVIGADQIIGLDGRRFDKPTSVEEARENLTALRGRVHTLFTAACVVSGKEILWRTLATPQVSMRSWSPAALDAHIAAEGEDVCATVGGYKLEGRGVQLIEAVRGDYFAILGLPLLELLGFLRERGLIDP